MNTVLPAKEEENILEDISEPGGIVYTYNPSTQEG